MLLKKKAGEATVRALPFSPVVADVHGHTCSLDIPPLEEYSVPRKRSRANFSAVDQRLDMGKVYWMVAVLANQRYRFCGGHPVVVHGGISLSAQHSRLLSVGRMVDGLLAEGCSSVHRKINHYHKMHFKLALKLYFILKNLSMH